MSAGYCERTYRDEIYYMCVRICTCKKTINNHFRGVVAVIKGIKSNSPETRWGPVAHIEHGWCGIYVVVAASVVRGVRDRRFYKVKRKEAIEASTAIQVRFYPG